jgi:hypothetical protein
MQQQQQRRQEAAQRTGEQAPEREAGGQGDRTEARVQQVSRLVQPERGYALRSLRQQLEQASIEMMVAPARGFGVAAQGRVPANQAAAIAVEVLLVPREPVVEEGDGGEGDVDDDRQRRQPTQRAAAYTSTRGGVYLLGACPTSPDVSSRFR